MNENEPTDSSTQIKVEHEDPANSPAESSAQAPDNVSTEPSAPSEPPTPEQIAEWKEQAEKAGENYDRLLRLTAEFDNFRKRSARDRSDAIKFANEGLLERLIPTLDHFDMAMSAANSAESLNVQSLQTGIKMVFDQFKAILHDAGLEEIDAVGQQFDPALHEAVAQTETTDSSEGHVLEQTRKGYKLKDRLLRPASVIVAKRPQSDA